MKAHPRVDAESGLVHTVRVRSGNVNDATQASGLLHGDETDAFADAGYRGVDKRPEADGRAKRHVTMRPGKRRALDLNSPLAQVIEQVEKIKASLRAKVEHPLRVIERQFGLTKVCYRGLINDTVQITTLFAPGNLWMARRNLMGAR